MRREEKKNNFKKITLKKKIVNLNERSRTFSEESAILLKIGRESSENNSLYSAGELIEY